MAKSEAEKAAAKAAKEAEKAAAKADPETRIAAKRETLAAAGVDLIGDESEEVLDAKLKALEPEKPEEHDDSKDALPRTVAPRFEKVQIEGREQRLGMHFVYSENGKSALYNEAGVRISPIYGPEDHADPSDDSSPKGVTVIAKAAARNNIERRKHARDHVVR